MPRSFEKMDKNECRRLISLYGANRWLWDARDPNYTNRGMRDDSWLHISREMNISVTDLKKKMESLLGSYRREKSREKKSRVTGSGRDEVYKSTWYAYDCFSFMADRHDPGITRETLDIDETNTNENMVRAQGSTPPADIDNVQVLNQDPTPTDGNDVQIVDHAIQYEHATQQIQQHDTQTDNGLQNSQTSNNKTQNPLTFRKRSKKRTTKQIDDITEDTINEAYKLLQQCAASESQPATTIQSDAYSVFGQYIANELRKYDPITLAHIKNDICGIIFQADTGAYRQYGYYTESYDYARPSSSSYSYVSLSTPSPQSPLPPQSPLLPPQSPLLPQPPLLPPPPPRPPMTMPPPSTLPSTSPPIDYPPVPESK